MHEFAGRGDNVHHSAPAPRGAAGIGSVQRGGADRVAHRGRSARRARIAVLTLLTAAGGCAPPLILPSSARTWNQTARETAQALETGNYDIAEERLQGYIAANRSRAEVAEAWLWLAVIRSDPVNKGTKAGAALAALDSAVAHGGTGPAGTVAAALRRQMVQTDAAARELEQARRALTSARQAAAATPQRPAAEPANLAEEVARLRRELDKANEELARVKRTLRQRRP